VAIAFSEHGAIGHLTRAIATRSTLTGRHEGDLMGTAPTGRDVSFSMLTISRCRDGKIEEEWEVADTISLLQQVGAVPEVAKT